MSSEVRISRPGDGATIDFDYHTASAWHISTPSLSHPNKAAHRISDPRSTISGFSQHDVPRESWQVFESDETLHSTPAHSRRQSTQALEKDFPSTPPSAVGFWSPSLAKTRRDVFFNYLKTLLMLCVFVLVVLSIYWGVLFRIYQELEHVTVAVVDFDGLAPDQDVDPVVGPAVVSAALSQLSLPRHIGYTVRPPSEFGDDPMNVRIAVHDEKYWAAIIINRNATSLLTRAVNTGNSSYDPFGAAQIIYNQARDIEAYNQYVTPVLLAFAADVSASFGRNWTTFVLNDQRLDRAIYARAPQAISPGIEFSIYNLRPFDPPTAIPTVSIGLIYLIIIAFFSFGFFIPTHLKFILPNPKSPHPPLKFAQLILWRYLATIFAYFCLSLSYSLVSLAFQIPFSNTPPSSSGITPRHWPKTEVASNADFLGHATFVVYWLLNFLGMTALGLACENMAMLLGTPWTALWLIFWVITNVATGFYSLELASDFYRWGYAWPLRQIVVGSRTLLFGTKDMLAVNFGVLAAWVAVGSLLFPACCWVFRWKSIREKRKTAAMQAGTAPPPPAASAPKSLSTSVNELVRPQKRRNFHRA